MARIGLTGTHSSGKTTLASALSSACGLPLRRGDRARDIALSLGAAGQRLDNLSPAQQWEMQWRFLSGFTDAATSLACVCDGMPLSCLPYGRALLGDAFSGQEATDFITEVERAAAAFDTVFYLPPEIDLELDGFRPPSEEFRAAMDWGCLAALGGRQFTALTGTVDDRAHTAAFAMGLAATPPRPRHIALEGLPRAGKTTQIGLLMERLRHRGNAWKVERNHYRIDGVHVQDVIAPLYADPDKNRDRLLDLHVATFAHHHATNDVAGRLAQGETVVSDRQKFSIIAMGRALGHDWGTLYRATRHLPTPGLVIYLDADPDTCVSRAGATGQGHNLKGDVDFQSRVSEAFRWLAAHHAEIVTVNARRPVDEVARDVWRTVEQRIDGEVQAEAA